MLWKECFMPHPNVPDPVELGWKCNEEGHLEFDWCEGNMMPIDLIDVSVLEEANEEQEETTADVISESLSDEIFANEDSDDDL